MERKANKLSKEMQILRQQVNQMRKQMYACTDECTISSTDSDDVCSSASDFEFTKDDLNSSDSEWDPSDEKFIKNKVESDESDDDDVPLSHILKISKCDTVQQDSISLPSTSKTTLEECVYDTHLELIPSGSTSRASDHKEIVTLNNASEGPDNNQSIDGVIESNETHLILPNEKESKGRKRKSKLSKREERKRKYNYGIEHETESGKGREQRKLRNGCTETCKRKCKNKISEEQRQVLLKAFWDLGSNERRWDFVSASVHESIPKYRRSQATKPKQSSRKYTFSIGNEEVVVCKKFYLDTLDVSETLVTTALIKKNEVGVVQKDLRGRHASRPHALGDEKDQIRNHISSFPVVASHYCRQTSSRKYLESSLSIQHMHRLYVQKRTSEGAEHIASLTRYKDVFYNDFNLGFHKPKKDTCEECSIFHKTGIKTDNMIKAQEEHMKSAKAVREYRDKIKEEVKVNPTQAGATFDLEEVLQLPKSTEGVLYYKRKLNNYNLSIFDYETATGFNYLWNETVAKRGSVDIASCVYKYLQLQARKNKKKVSLFSDSCGGQNRNRNFTAMLWYAAQTSDIEEIEHVFFVRGHSENESDSIHARIEQASKHASVYTTQQWAIIIQTAKRNRPFYKVDEMTNDDFFDFKSICDGFANTSKTMERERMHWMQIRKYTVKKHDPCVTVQYSMDESQVHIMNLFQTGRKSFEMTVPSSLKPAYNKPLPIDKNKSKDLIDLCQSGVIPAAYHHFYHSLPVTDSQIDPSSDADNSSGDE